MNKKAIIGIAIYLVCDATKKKKSKEKKNDFG